MHQYRLRAFGWHNGNRHSFFQITSIGGADWSGKWQLAVRFMQPSETASQRHSQQQATLCLKNRMI